jgi:hypothetical protein
MARNPRSLPSQIVRTETSADIHGEWSQQIRSAGRERRDDARYRALDITARRLLLMRVEWPAGSSTENSTGPCIQWCSGVHFSLRGDCKQKFWQNFLRGRINSVF